MKKITALLLAMIVAAMCAVTTFAAPATTAGTVYDFVANFTTAKDLGFSVISMHKVHGSLSDATEWFDGTQEPGPNYKGKHLASNGALKGWGSYNSDGWGVGVGLLGDTGTDVVWFTGNAIDNVIAFTAPTDGLYSYDIEGSQYWDTNASSAKYYVKVNGEIHNNNVASFEQGKTKAETAYNFEGSVELSKGQTIQLWYDCEDSSAGDNGQITKLQIKLERQGKAPLNNQAGCVYDLLDNLGNPAYASFSLGIAEKATGNLLESTATWYNGDDDTVKHAGSGNALKGWSIKAVDGNRVDMGFIDGSNLVWYPGNDHDNVIIFTAPVAGTYTYEFASESYWAVAHSTADYYVSVNGEPVKAESVAVGTDKGEPSRVTFTATVELNAGDTIYYATTAGDSSAGDNNKLLTAKVTLDEVNANPAPNPGTSDVAISIATVIAALGIFGFAVATKKH